jgi:hypothetical protein
VTYFVLIPVVAVIVFLLGSAVAWFAMSDRIEPTDDENAESQPAH